MKSAKFKVSVTIKHKNENFIMPMWDKVSMILDGDKRDLLNLQAQLNIVKAQVNQAVNQNGFALKDVDIIIDIL